MFENIMSKMNIVHDGMWSAAEIVLAAAVAIAAILVVVLIIRMIVSRIRNRSALPSTIFSHRKNKYKDRIGKKVKF